MRVPQTVNTRDMRMSFYELCHKIYLNSSTVMIAYVMLCTMSVFGCVGPAQLLEASKKPSKWPAGAKIRHIQCYRLLASLRQNSTVDCRNGSMARARDLSNAGSSRPENGHVFAPRNWAGDLPDDEKNIKNLKKSGLVFAPRNWAGFRAQKMGRFSRPENGQDFVPRKRRETQNTHDESP